jgi:hypothetical protein
MKTEVYFCLVAWDMTSTVYNKVAFICITLLIWSEYTLIELTIFVTV